MNVVFKMVTLCGIFFYGCLCAQGFTEKFETVFETALNSSLQGPGQSGRNFTPANNQVNRQSIAAFNDFLSAHVANMPQGGTATGLSFDFSNGAPVAGNGSLGPIFSEIAPTLGKGQFNIGLLLNYLSYSSARGTDINDISLTFTHNDISQSGLGDSDEEWDRIQVAMNMDIRATIFNFVSTLGLSDRIDVGVALPFISVKINSDPVASIISQTYLQSGLANVYYGGSSSAPVLQKEITGINEEATGIGDLLLRGKYHFYKDNRLDLAGMLSVQLATGDEKNFLGSGASSLKLGLIGSTRYGNMTPHFNFSYHRQAGDARGDELEIFLGYDQHISPTITLVIDLLAEFQISDIAAQSQFPQSVQLAQEVSNNVTYRRQISLSNLPDRLRDHRINSAFGVKYSPREDLIIIANLLAPLNSGGLRTTWTPTIGFDFSF